MSTSPPLGVPDVVTPTYVPSRWVDPSYTRVAHSKGMRQEEIEDESTCIKTPG